MGELDDRASAIAFYLRTAGFSVLAIYLLYLGDEQWGRFQRLAGSTFDFRGNLDTWFAGAALYTAGGLIFGLALRSGLRLGGFRWWRTLALSALPLWIGLAIPMLFWGVPIRWPARWVSSGTVETAWVLVGVAVATGFADHPRRREASESSRRGRGTAAKAD